MMIKAVHWSWSLSNQIYLLKKGQVHGNLQIQVEVYKGVDTNLEFGYACATKPFGFRCTVCCKTLSCIHQGIADVRTHIVEKNHQSLVRGMEVRTWLSFTADLLVDKVNHQSKCALPFIVMIK